LRVWTDEEDAFVSQKIGDIAKDHLEAKNQPSFAHMRGLLNGVALSGGNGAVENASNGALENTSAKKKSPAP
jgi:hypothetical protein